MSFEIVKPEDIERRSFELIEAELPHPLPEELAPIIKRVIHTTADFDYADSLYFSEGVLEKALLALSGGATIVTDTNMACAGINKGALKKLGGRAVCFMADEDVAEAAKQNGTTRAVASMDKAAGLEGPVIFAIGNAPTALIRLDELMKKRRLCPALIVGVPVGFVNVVASKELICESGAPCIVARGRKGGSNVAASVINALMYLLTRSA
ncbi:MAG: precorrin-8X methylmutase [Oscillibacter sp.]|nr:precorrin-8X methylmutase [Oscillibacter sp.]